MIAADCMDARGRARLRLFYAWVCVATYAYPFLWTIFVSTPLPIKGLRGVLDPWVGVPCLLLAIASVVMLSAPQFQRIGALYFWGGVLSAAGFTLAWYVSNGGGFALAFSGMCLVSRGSELLNSLGKLGRLECNPSNHNQLPAQTLPD